MSMNLHQTIKPVYYLSRIFHLWPYKYKNVDTMVSLTLFEIFFAHLLNIIHIVWVFWSYYSKMQYIQVKGLSPVTVDEIFLFPLHIFIFYSIAWTNSKQEKLANTFFNRLNFIDKNELFFSNSVHEHMYKNTIWRLSLIFLIAGTMSLLDMALVFQFMGFKRGLYHVIAYFNYIRLIVVVLQIINKAELLEEYFRQVNVNLEKIFDNEELDYRRVNEENEQKNHAKKIRRLCKVHVELCDLIRVNTKMHGMQILMLFCSLTSLMLFSLYYGLLFGIGNKTYKAKVGHEAFLATVQITIFLKHLALSTIVVQQYVATMKEAFKARNIVHRLLVILPVGFLKLPKKLCKTELQLFAREVVFENPMFSAAGFHNVDNEMLFSLISIVLYYFIVLFQWQSGIKFKI